MARVAVVVVNFNGGPLLEARLDAFHSSVLAVPDGELIVVDNCSEDGSSESAETVCRRLGFRFIRNERNVGYAAAVNRAVSASDAEYIAVCNMDVLVSRDWLLPLVDWLDANQDCAAANPLILLSGGRAINAAGQSVHLTLLGFNRYLGRDAAEAPQRPEIIAGVQGAAFLVRRSALERVGGMPEAGFLYHEDVHLSLRLRLAGYQLYCVPSSRVEHDYSLSMYPEKFFLLERNRIETLLTCFRLTTLLVLTPCLAFTEILAWGFALLRGPSFVSAKCRSYLSVGERWQQTRAARARAEEARVTSDRVILGELSLLYEWNQFSALARERTLRREARVPGSYCM